MSGFNRQIDPVTRDYVRDDATNSVKKTRDASTPIYYQAITKLGQWWGDPDAGSTLYTFENAKSLLSTPAVIQDVFRQLLQPLIDEGRITAPSFEQVRNVDRIDTEVTVDDVQTGEKLQLSDLLSFSP